MSKPPGRTVRVAQLKARLSEYLRTVRRGYPVTVLDRDTPIARLVPVESASESLPTRKPLRSLREIELPKRLARPVDSLAVLLQERQQR
jgi:prevent-host-death family protein